MRLGLFGGTFDPIHFGHLLLAESCREAVPLDQILFMPAAQSPHKLDRIPASGIHRLQMIRLATAGRTEFEVSDLEIARGGVSYTVDTLEVLREAYPEAELYLLMGGDSLADFIKWRDVSRICELAHPLVVHRPHSPLPSFDLLASVVGPARLEELRRLQVEMPLIELSSRDIRQRVRAGRSIRYRTPRAVEMFIRAQRLYGTEEAHDRSRPNDLLPGDATEAT